MSVRQYETISSLGSGTYGDVVQIKAPSGEQYALKQLIPVEDLVIVVDVTEIDLLRKVDHPYVMNAVDYITQFNDFEVSKTEVSKTEESNVSYPKIVMPLGTSTGCDIKHQALSTSNSEPQKIVFMNLVTIMHRLLLGLKYMNELGYIHADIKHSNIVFYNVDHPVLIDFGSSIYIGTPDKEIKLMHMRTTPQYAAPESVNKSCYSSCIFSHKGDIWSMGTVFYSWLFGQLLCEADGGACNFGRIEELTRYDVLYESLTTTYPGVNDINDIWYYTIAKMLNGMLQRNLADRLTSDQALTYLKDLEHPPLDQAIVYRNKYFDPLTTNRANFDDFATARRFLLSLMVRLGATQYADIEAMYVYIICEAYWRCYLATPIDFDLWEALAVSIYTYVKESFLWRIFDNSDIVKDLNTNNLCYSLVATYNQNGLVDVGNYRGLKNRANVDNMFVKVFWCDDPQAIVDYFAYPKSRPVVDLVTDENIDDYDLRSMIKSTLPTILDKQLYQSLFKMSIYNAKYSYCPDMWFHEDDDVLNPFKHSKFIETNGIKL